MAKLNPKKTALALGVVVAAWVLLWAVVLGIGGPGVFDRLMSLHFITGISLVPVTIGLAITSIIYHFVVGAILGRLFATVWNKLAA